MKFEKVYYDYWQKVFRLCMGYVNDEMQAKDITQEVFIKVLVYLPKFRNESSIGTWIFKIASNQCLSHIYKENKIPRTFLPSTITEQPSETETIEKQSKLLYQFISELPETERIIISLELEDIKQDQIAEIIGISSGNVRVKIHRIKDKLTKKFKKYGY